MLLFGLIQIVMSQIPNFHNMEWLSVVAAIMSFSYSSIGLGLGFAQVIGRTVNLPSFCLFISLQLYKHTLWWLRKYMRRGKNLNCGF